MIASYFYSSRPGKTIFDRADAGGISASSRWLRSVSDDTTGKRHNQEFLHPCRGASSFLFDTINGGVAALNHRLLAMMPPASSNSSSQSAEKTTHHRRLITYEGKVFPIHLIVLFAPIATLLIPIPSPVSFVSTIETWTSANLKSPMQIASTKQARQGRLQYHQAFE